MESALIGPRPRAVNAPGRAHRALFAAGAFVAAAGVTPWFAFALGIDTLYRPILRAAGYRAAFHPTAEVQGFLSLFALGLLFTVLPRRTGAPRAAWWEVSLGAAAGVAVAWAGWAERWDLAQTAWLVVLALAGAFVARRLHHLPRPFDPRACWLAAGLVAGLAGAAFATLGASNSRGPLGDVGRGLLWQGVFTAVALGVAHLVDRRPSTPPRSAQGERTVAPLRASGPGAGGRAGAWLAHASGAALLLATFALDGLASRRAGFAARAVLTAAFTAGPALAALRRATAGPRRLAAAALAALPVGYGFAALDPEHRRAGLHLIYLGTFTGLALLAWTARTSVAVRLPAGTPWTAGLLAAALVARVVLEFDAPSFHLWLGLACGAFAAAVVTWAVASLRSAA